MRLLSDLDGTIFPTYETIARLVLSQTGECIDWKPTCEDNTHPFWKTPEGQCTRQAFQNNSLYAHLQAYPCVNEILSLAVHTGWEIMYVTARYSVNTDATYFSLGNNRLPFARVIFVEREFAHLTKAQLALDYGAELFIDDEVKVCQELDKWHVPFVQIPQGYNTSTWKPAMVTSTWNKIRKILKGEK